MPELRHLRAQDARRVPWRNGRGATLELALWPAGSSFEAGDFDWRLSTAAVEEPGPFSSFPGFDRLLLVTRGAGLTLEHGSDAPCARVRPLEPYRFSGDWTTTAELVDGAVQDVNVLVRRSAARAELDLLRLGDPCARTALAAGQVCAHLLRGRARLRLHGQEGVVELAAGESLRIDGLRGSEELELRGDGPGALVLLVQILAPAPSVSEESPTTPVAEL